MRSIWSVQPHQNLVPSAPRCTCADALRPHTLQRRPNQPLTVSRQRDVFSSPQRYLADHRSITSGSVPSFHLCTPWCTLIPTDTQLHTKEHIGSSSRKEPAM